MTSSSHARAARIGARIRHHIASPTWDWRTMSAEDDDDAAAIERLRDEASRARRWLELASLAIGQSLPVGNGTNGPWHRLAVVDSDGHFGVLDIANGLIRWTDTKIPSYVRRFTVATDAGSSVHQAGGHGSMGSAVAQIALVLGIYGDRAPIIRVPRPEVTWIEWGLTTCYASIGTAPKDATVPLIETSLPQSEEIKPPSGPMCREVAEKVVAFVQFRIRATVRVTEGAVDHAGCRGDCEWNVLGTRVERAIARDVILTVHAAIGEEYVRHATIRARIDAGLSVSTNDRLELRSGPNYRHVARCALKDLGV